VPANTEAHRMHACMSAFEHAHHVMSCCERVAPSQQHAPRPTRATHHAASPAPWSGLCTRCPAAAGSPQPS
jgi:hypothetical protein